MHVSSVFQIGTGLSLELPSFLTTNLHLHLFLNKIFMGKKGGGHGDNRNKRGGHRGRGGAQSSRRTRALDDDFGRPESLVDDFEGMSMETRHREEDEEPRRRVIDVPVAMWVRVSTLIDLLHHQLILSVIGLRPL